VNVLAAVNIPQRLIPDPFGYERAVSPMLRSCFSPTESVPDMKHSDKSSMWLADAPPISGWEPSPGELAARVDVVVVGAGLAGLCTAMSCVEDGATVAIIDAGRIAGRTTGHSTAKLTALHGLTYARLIRGKGSEAAAAYASANVAALVRLRDWITTMHIDCDLVEATAYTCAATGDGVKAVEAEVDA